MSHRKSKARRHSRAMQTSPISSSGLSENASAADPVVGISTLEPVDHDVIAASSSIDLADSEMSAPDCMPDEPFAVQSSADAVAIGQRLQEARATAGLDVQDAARQLKLPHRVLEKLERGDWSGIDSPLYLRGYLRSYSKLLGIEPPQIEPTTPALPITPPLVSTGGIPRSQYLLHRYTTAATYLGLTALVVVPLVVLGLHGGLKQDLTRLVPLDPPAADSVMLPETGSASVPKVVTEKSNIVAEEGMPLLASMTPMPMLDGDSAKHAAPPERPAPARDVASGLDIHLEAPSWVEIHAADGSRIEYALLEAGDHHYDASGELSVRLGNAQDAVVRVDGKIRELEPYRRANVAHFRVDADGAMQPPRG